jgi:4-diphosphocytidyl-2-C-methyl-D-erythritol kinase
MEYGFMITVKKQIPIGGGLGGGSSNAATFIRFLAQYCHLPYTPAQLIPFAKSFGADVPFFLDGGTQLVRGIGDSLSCIHPTYDRYFVLILPSIKISTKMVFNAYDLFNSPSKSSETPNIILQEQLGDNMLKETVFKLYPKLESICQQFKQLGCPTIRLSGSGSTLFFVVSSWEEAQCWQLKLHKKVKRCDVMAVKPVRSTSRTTEL